MLHELANRFGLIEKRVYLICGGIALASFIMELYVAYKK